MYKLHQYWEHCDVQIPGLAMPPGGREILFPKKRGGDGACVWLAHSKGKVRLKSSYYIGVDWIDKQNAIYIAPKLNEGARQTDYLKMLFSCLKHPEVLEHTDDLFEIKFDQPFLEIEQKQDLLTPLLVIQFLRVVHSIVKKGLKKSYYPIEENLHGRIKSKVLVGQTIKQNIVKNRPLNTLCRYEEFGWNGLENRLLKKALLFSQRYLAGGISGFTVDVSTVMNYCLPAFETVSEKIGLTEIKYTKTNAFYKEYKECTRLAKLILKRFGYNIQTVKQNKEVKVPPFWIDMSKLFELYVLGLLKDKFGKDVWYHFTTQWNELDYLLNTPTHKMVIDAKYKPVYQNSYDINDIRQLSGYARIANVVSELGVDPGQVVDCLIIYPDQYLGANEIFPEKFKSDPIGKFIRFYKMGVKLPEITT